MINSEDGRFALDCFKSPEGLGEPMTEFSECLEELESRAKTVLKAGAYPYLELWEWKSDDWVLLEAYR